MLQKYNIFASGTKEPIYFPIVHCRQCNAYSRYEDQNEKVDNKHHNVQTVNFST
jgi:hypothetical protein